MCHGVGGGHGGGRAGGVGRMERGDFGERGHCLGRMRTSFGEAAEHGVGPAMLGRRPAPVAPAPATATLNPATATPATATPANRPTATTPGVASALGAGLGPLIASALNALTGGGATNTTSPAANPVANNPPPATVNPSLRPPVATRPLTLSPGALAGLGLQPSSLLNPALLAGSFGGASSPASFNTTLTAVSNTLPPGFA